MDRSAPAGLFETKEFIIIDAFPSWGSGFIRIVMHFRMGTRFKSMLWDPKVPPPKWGRDDRHSRQDIKTALAVTYPLRSKGMRG